MNQRIVFAVLFALTLLAMFALVSCGGGPNDSPQVPASGLSIVSTPPTQATEGSTYSYTLQANVQGVSFALTNGPSGANLSGNTITWNPSSQQARTANQFSVTASYAGTNAKQDWSVTPSGTIRGTTADTCVSDSGQTTSIIGYPAGATVKALTPNSNGGFDTYTSTVAQDGTFSIRNVPAGSFWLLLPMTNLWTSSSSVELGYRQWGGCHAESLSSVGTSFQATVDGLNPWQHYDYFYFAVPNARTGYGAVTNVGSTSLSFTIPYNNLMLLSSSNGDNGYYAQLVSATYGGIEFHALKQFAGPQPITVQNGVVNPAAATLQPVTQSAKFRATVRGSAFAALHDSMFPGISAVDTPGDNLRIDISADSTSPLSNGMYLVLASQAFPSDTDAGDVPFANPYPSSWTPFLDYTEFAVQSLVPPGATSPVKPALITRVVRADLPTTSKPIVPLVGPALNPKINGSSLFDTQTISGTTPTLSWQAPSVGTASGYLINIDQVVVSNGTPSLQWMGSYITTSTSVMLPPGVLSSGKSYWFQIQSLYRKDVDMSVTPHRESLPEGESDLGSGLVTVQ